MSKPISKEVLLKINPKIKDADEWANLMDGVLESFGINTINRKAMFLAQTIHETGGYRFLKEIWGPTKWQERYEGHKGLGNVEPGDGKKFLGRGLIQLTGRANYTKFNEWLKSNHINDDVVKNPDLLATDKSLALLAAIWFWNKNNLNKFADSDNIEMSTKIINGPGMLGLDERKLYYERAKQALA